ncbi:carbamate kinase [Malonomonas rubra DSM 5091]|uniref:Carbamate kinase n=1 Tax=Malonomonas rubra DSM 5091 TaxID=1122189 RepID=A0A1M6LYN8_MALRU|nr:carbamate kinase [Malonomonas rubra]SHJ76282.1 carbamate kinase [Malonomonas rubra DSM 5091]
MNRRGMRETLVIALGGNALIRKGQAGTIEEQFANLKGPMQQIARLSMDFRIIITHGNGPQVGNLLLQQESCCDVPKLPLEILVAQTQGQLGYMIESTLDTEFMKIKGAQSKQLVSLISYVVVDEADPAFQKPSKPVGPSYPEGAVDSLPWPVVKTANGYRRVVASPAPVTIVEKQEIRKLVAMDFIVICCGGGGIPVIREERGFHGVDAVIDKDLASARLASEVEADVLVIATDVEGAALSFGQPEQKFLRHISCVQAEQWLRQGHFPAGSMGPKVKAAVQFVREGGKRSIITSLDAICEAVSGTAGTEIRKHGG